MNKAEYRIRTDEIKELIEEREYAQAAAVADEIDWRRVRSVKMLCTVSDLYKINRRFDDAKNILLIAYRKNPQSRTILYALCDLSIRLQELLDAIEYYKAFVQVAPKDAGRYVLQYRLYQAQDVSLEERIDVLEALKKEEYTERWGYELALLYHRCGQVEKCVAECNELILWFGEGKYVTKAMELKMLHEPLTQSQQYLYEHRGMSGIAAPDEEGAAEQNLYGDDRQMAQVVDMQTVSYSDGESVSEPEEITAKPMDVENKYSTMNLQRELAESLRAILGETKKPAVEPEPVQEQETFVEEEVLFEQEQEASEGEAADVRFDTKEVLSLADIPRDRVVEIYREPVVLNDKKPAFPAAQPAQPIPPQPAEAVEPLHIMEVQHPDQEQDSMLDMTRMESDGQIGMVLPEPVRLEKQITGQLSIADILEEWERRNQQIEAEHRNEIYERIREQTGDIFAEFDARQKEDILDELQKLTDTEEERLRKQDLSGLDEEEQTDIFEEEPEETDGVIPEMDEEAGQPEDYFGVAEDEPAEMFDPQEEALLMYEEEPEFAYGEEPLLPQEDEAFEEDTVSADEPAAVVFREEIPERYRRYVHSDDSMREIQSAIQNAALPVSAGNIVVEGDNYDYCFDFARQLLSDLRDKGMKLSGKLARISAINLNRKKVAQILDTLEGGAMVIERISMLSAGKMQDIENALREGKRNLLLILVDTPEAIHNLSVRRPDFMEYFPLRVNMQGMSARELVQYGSAYAYSEEYEIDEMALLALQTRIEDEEAGDHVPMPEDVEAMVNAAIRHVNRIGMRKFLTTLTGSRYNEEDMIILKEQDFA